LLQHAPDQRPFLIAGLPAQIVYWLTMNVSELNAILAQHPEAPLRFVLPDGQKVPAHAHVTEVARIDKRFVDCGGTRRTETFCRLQTWVANDLDHRLTAGKLLGILRKAESILESEELDVDIEHEAQFISQFPLASVLPVASELVFQLSVRHTACLAEDKCLPKNQRSPTAFKPLPSFTRQSQPTR
jgi:hypothetical protein